jgi:hypothetical protein
MEEGFILTHDFRFFSPWSFVPLLWACAEAQHSWQGVRWNKAAHLIGSQETE